MHKDIQLLYNNPLKTQTEYDTRTHRLLEKRARNEFMKQFSSSNSSLTEEEKDRAELLSASPLIRYFSMGYSTTQSYKPSHHRKKCT